MQQSRLMRSETDKMLAGVCGGLAAYLGIDPVLVRLAFVLLLLASGIGLVIYVILWVIMPTEGGEHPEIRIFGDNAADPAGTENRFSPAATMGIVLILLGGFLMLSQWGRAPGYIWPIILIGAGLFYLLRRTR